MRILLLAILLVGVPCMVADAKPEPPARATGPLSPQEEIFRGEWNAYDVESKRLEYAMAFDGREFRAQARPDEKDRDENYEGYVVIRPDVEPAQIDFVVLDESGKPGRISKEIFRIDDEVIVIKAPESGLPRPKTFEQTEGPLARLRLSREE
jgi:hypothetical protein